MISSICNNFAFYFFFLDLFKSTWMLINNVLIISKLMNMIQNPYKLASLIILNFFVNIFTRLFCVKFDIWDKLLIINTPSDSIKSNLVCFASYCSNKLRNNFVNFSNHIFIKMVFCITNKFALFCWKFLLLHIIWTTRGLESWHLF